MPTYQYACTECADRLEVVQRFSDDPLTVCSACGGKLRKVFSAVGIVFKGSGFYRNDSRAGAVSGGSANGNGGGKAGGEGSDAAGGKSDSGARSESGAKSGANDSGSSEKSGSTKSKSGKGSSAGAGSGGSDGASSKVA